MIAKSREEVFRQVNKALIELYYNIGRYISNKEAKAGWGQNTVQELSNYILGRDNDIRGFSARNLWRMKQFYEAYTEKLSALLTEISWTNHLIILSKTKTTGEKEFYLNLAAKQKYSSRDLERIIDSSTYERSSIADKKLSAVLTELQKDRSILFKDKYVFEFLGINEEHKETDLRKALVNHLKKFLLELGPDFSLIGEEYTLQVGMKDFRVDLLMHNRELN